MDTVAEVFVALAVLAAFYGVLLGRAARARRLREDLARIEGRTAEEEAVEREILAARRQREGEGRLPLPFRWLERRARQAGVRMDPGMVTGLTAGAAAGLFLLGWSVTGVAWIGALAMAGGVAAPLGYLNWLARRRMQRVTDQLEQLCRQVGQAMRAGMTLQLALDDAAKEMPAPLGDEVRQVMRSFRIAGTPLREAVGQLERGVPLPETQLLVSAMRIHLETGANLPDILDGVIQTLHERRELRSAMQAATAQGRLQMNLLLLLPFALLLVFRLMAPVYTQPLFHTTSGLMIFFFGILWEFLGWRVMRLLMDVGAE